MSNVLICPYCGSEKTGNELGCCGESRDHFELVEEECQQCDGLGRYLTGHYPKFNPRTMEMGIGEIYAVCDCEAGQKQVRHLEEREEYSNATSG